MAEVAIGSMPRRAPRPWEAEVEITAAQVRHLVASQFPSLAGREVTMLSAGWDNTAFRVGEDLVFLLDGHGGAAGVIDWGDVHLGDPAADLMVLFAFLPAEGRETFLSAYGPVDGGTRSRARARAAWHSAAVAWYGIEIGDARLVETGREGLGYVLEE